MEVYYKDLISKDASLEKLVDELAMVVQGAGEFVEEAASHFPEERKAELKSRLQRLMKHCRQLKRRATGGARVADRAIRLNPYLAVGCALGAGLLAGTLMTRKR